MMLKTLFVILALLLLSDAGELIVWSQRLSDNPFKKTWGKKKRKLLCQRRDYKDGTKGYLISRKEVSDTDPYSVEKQLLVVSCSRIHTEQSDEILVTGIGFNQDEQVWRFLKDLTATTPTMWSNFVRFCGDANYT